MTTETQAFDLIYQSRVSSKFITICVSDTAIAFALANYFIYQGWWFMHYHRGSEHELTLTSAVDPHKDITIQGWRLRNEADNSSKG